MQITLPCAQCGRPAAAFTVHAAGEGDGLWRDHDRIERAGFMGVVIKFGSLESLAQLFETLRRHDYETLRRLDADFIAFHCWECGKDYCEQCWRIGPPEFDDGFYDCTMGICPAGHEQMVDD
ncbi:MAG: hypothetical protein FJ030_01235 [Chloroflexi bacterium]|nr:hypothetical protein [Chloroflexota bacterium]